MAATGRKGAGCRVLVVDDNLDNAESLSMFVRLLGHEVETAHDGLQAIEVAQRFAPDLVLLDIGLPKLDGYEVAQRLRADATCKARAWSRSPAGGATRTTIARCRPASITI
jgi:CheY-like chemotaxis protein